MDDDKNEIVRQSAELEKRRSQLAKRGLDVISKLDERVNLLSAPTINEQNAAQVTCLANFERGTLHDIFWTPDGKHIIAATELGFYFYEAQSLMQTSMPAKSNNSQAESERIPASSLAELGKWLEEHPGAKIISVTLPPMEPWDAKPQKEVRFIDAPNLCAAISPDGTLLAAGGADGNVRLWRTVDGTLINTLKEDGVYSYLPDSISFSPDNSLLAVAAIGSFASAVRLWRVADGTLLKRLGGGSDAWSLALSPDGKLLAFGDYKKTCIWEVSDGAYLSTLEQQSGMVCSLAFSPDGTHLASGSEDKIYIWKMGDYALIKTLEGNSDFTDLAFSPDSSLLASGCYDGTIRLWETPAGDCLKVLDGHSDEVTSISFSPKGNLIASASKDGTIRLWGIKP